MQANKNKHWLLNSGAMSGRQMESALVTHATDKTSFRGKRLFCKLSTLSSSYSRAGEKIYQANSGGLQALYDTQAVLDICNGLIRKPLCASKQKKKCFHKRGYMMLSSRTVICTRMAISVLPSKFTHDSGWFPAQSLRQVNETHLRRTMPVAVPERAANTKR